MLIFPTTHLGCWGEGERRLSPPLGHFLLVYRTEVMKQARQAAKVAIHLATCVSICISHAAIIKKCGYNCSFLMQTYNIIYLSYNDFIYSVCEEHWKLSVARVKSEFSGHDTYQSRKCKYNQNSLSIHSLYCLLFLNSFSQFRNVSGGLYFHG